MKHWIVMFRPETYEAAQEHGLMGALYRMRRRFSAIEEGDKFVAYISRKRILDAHGEVTGDAFHEVSNTPEGWGFYTERAPIRFDQTGAGVDARELLWGLTVASEGIKTTPTNLIFCKGGFMEIPEDDYVWLRDVLAGKTPATPVRDG